MFDLFTLVCLVTYLCLSILAVGDFDSLRFFFHVLRAGLSRHYGKKSRSNTCGMGVVYGQCSRVGGIDVIDIQDAPCVFLSRDYQAAK